MLAPTPNGAFWSVGVEAELYLLFPLFPLFPLVRRRLGPVALLAGVTLPVITFGLLAPAGTPVEGTNWLTPNLAPVFAAGLVAAGIVVARDRIRTLPWPWLTPAAATPVAALILVEGPTWTIHHYFWIDLAIVPAIILLLVAVATGRPAPLMRLLATRPIRSLGTFSYSLYLIHLPIVMIVGRRIAPYFTDSDLSEFWFTAALSVPLSVIAARVFAQVFEIPFQRHRSWTALAPAARAQVTGKRGA